MNDRSGQSLGTYRLIRLLGQGGFAEVYLGEHIHLNTQAAIKILLATKLHDEAEIENFRHEAQIIASLIHANVVRVWDFNIEQKTPFFVMEYAAQGSLRNIHSRGTRLPLLTIVTYVRQVADALHYAHKRKQIHRDVKPDNILVRDDGSLMLSDFGIATIAHSSISQRTEEMIGTVAYMAPEQTLGHPHFASDQYALAVTAYEWLAGRPPFRGTPLEIIGQHARAVPPSLVTQVSGLAAAVEQVLFKALAKEPKERFATIQEFALALEQAEQGIYSPTTFPEPLAQQSTPEKKAVSLPANTDAVPSIRQQAPTPLRLTEPIRQPTIIPKMPLEKITIQQLEAAITYANAHPDTLRDPLFQQRSAAFLIEQVEYWRKQGSNIFQQAVAQLSSAGTNQADPFHQAISIYLNSVARLIIPSLREGLQQFKSLEAQAQDPWKIPRHCGHLLIILVPPAHNEQFWLKLFDELEQPPLYELIKSDSLWPFHQWILDQASQLPLPQRLLSQMQPWLDISSWNKLEEVFAQNLPTEWVYAAIRGCLPNVPKGALSLIQKHEPLFIAALQQYLQQGSQTDTNDTSIFFQDMVEYGYPNRIPLLLALVNTYFEASFVQTIFACVGITTTHRLQTSEIDTVLAGCRPEVLATCNRAQALADYLQEFILALTPAKLASGQTTQLLNQLNQLNEAPGLPPLLPTEVAKLVSHWLMMSMFVTTSTLDRHLLAKTKTAIGRIFSSYRQPNSGNQVQTFANELVPILVAQARTETDLDMILDLIGASMTNTRWDLLRWMALLAGPSKAHIYELFPYVACGLREAEHTGQSQQSLNVYLQTIFVFKNHKMLPKFDTIVSNDIWPNAYRQLWEKWRNSHKKSDTGRFQIEQQVLRLRGSDNYTSLPEQPDIAFPERAQEQTKFVISLPTLNRSIMYEEYAKIHQVMPALLSYWLSEKLPENIGNSKSIDSEIKALKYIGKDLSSAPIQASRNLIMYLADDMIIEETIRNRVVSGTVIAQTLDPERYLPGEFSNFVAWTQTNIMNEESLRDGLRILIRRYLVLHQLDIPKNNLKDVFSRGGLEAFLNKERAKYVYII